MVVLNSSVTGSPSADAGLEIQRGTSGNVQLRWNETADKWQFSNDGTTYVNMASTADITAHENDTTNIHGIANTANLATLTDLSNHENDTTNIHGISNTAELVTLAGVQTLTNKTLTSPTITGVSPVITLGGHLSGSVTLTNLGNGTLTASIPANTITSAMIVDGAIVNADINSAAAIALSKLASGTSGQIIVADSSGVPTWVSETGDVTIDSSGVTAITANSIVNADISTSAAIDKTKISGTAITAADNGTVTSTMIADGTIVNADINNSAAIALSKLASGTSAQVIVADGSGVPTYRTLSGDITISNTGVVTIAADSVALGTDTTGNYMVNVAGGTGVTVTHTPGEGSTATVAIGQAVATNSEVTFAGVKTTSAIEVVSVSATAATGTIALDVANGTTYYTSNATANFTVNLRWNSGTTLDSKLAVGEMATTSFMVTNGGTAYFANAHQINGTAVTPRWQGGSAPSAGNANSIDMYTYTVLKTAANTFTLFAALTRFA